MMGAMRLPDFLIIGSQKAGTTALYRALRRHPQVFMPSDKELNVFFDRRRFGRGRRAYATRFADARPDQRCGEASPGYLVHPRAPGRIARWLPQVKLLVTVRDPIDRAYSQYWDNRRWLGVSVPFEALARPPMPAVYHPGQPGFISRGTYAIYLARYRALFAPEQIKVLRFGTLRRDPGAFFRAAFAFIGVDPDFDCPEMHSPQNPRSVFANPAYRFVFDRPWLNPLLPRGAPRLLRRGGRLPFQPPPIAPEVRRALVEFYRPYNARLEALLGVDLDWCRPG